MREREKPQEIEHESEARSNASYIIRPKVKPKKVKDDGEAVSGS